MLLCVFFEVTAFILLEEAWFIRHGCVRLGVTLHAEDACALARAEPPVAVDHQLKL